MVGPFVQVAGNHATPRTHCPHRNEPVATTAVRERRVGFVNAEVGIDDWVIGLMHVDDFTGIFHASLDSPSRRQQIEIWGQGYRALLQQAEKVAQAHVGLLETVGAPWWSR